MWPLLGDVAPELAEWAAYFASCSATRAAAEAGIERLVSTRDADDLLRQSEQFLELVTELVEGALTRRAPVMIAATGTSRRSPPA